MDGMCPLLDLTPGRKRLPDEEGRADTFVGKEERGGGAGCGRLRRAKVARKGLRKGSRSTSQYSGSEVKGATCL